MASCVPELVMISIVQNVERKKLSKMVGHSRTGNSEAFQHYIDVLAYAYDPVKRNELAKVSDSTNESLGFDDDSPDGISDPEDDYAYDGNGNMLSDQNKGITSITYNHLNLPVAVNFGSVQKIEYLYDATGAKKRKSVTRYAWNEISGGIDLMTDNIDYMEGYQYKKGELQFFPTAEGYVRNTYGALSHVFQYRDHLGNVRLSYAENPALPGTLSVIEENHYYPFGLQHTNYNSDQLEFARGETGVFLKEKPGDCPLCPKPVPPLWNNYKYNGKEFQDELGLNVYDYGARNYMPDLGRWGNMDPLGEKYFALSQYVYVANNPLLYIDPTGMTIEDPDGIVEKHKKKLQSDMDDVKKFIKNGQLEETLGNNLVKAFKNSINEISKMENSKQIYNVHRSSSDRDSGMKYNMKTKTVMIGINNDDYGLVGHELKHAHQFEKGEVSIIVDNTGYGSLYDVSDERESYNRERQLKSGRDYFENPKIWEWKNSDVINFGKSMRPAAYQTLPQGPININSRQGKDLKKNTIQAGKTGENVNEVYIGWEQDYQKGAKQKG